jgi:predicted ATPase
MSRPKSSSSSADARSPRLSARNRQSARSAADSTGFHSRSSSQRHASHCSIQRSYSRLDRRLPLLTGPSRDAPARQRTLRSAIEWSHELLEPEKQQLFRRLAVFAGSFALTATETVCDAELDLLESLVEKSLARRSGGGRLGMLDTIREYARAARRVGDRA